MTITPVHVRATRRSSSAAAFADLEDFTTDREAEGDDAARRILNV